MFWPSNLRWLKFCGVVSAAVRSMLGLDLSSSKGIQVWDSSQLIGSSWFMRRNPCSCFSAKDHFCKCWSMISASRKMLLFQVLGCSFVSLCLSSSISSVWFLSSGMLLICFRRFVSSLSWMLTAVWMTSNAIFAVATLALMRALVNRGGVMLFDMVI